VSFSADGGADLLTNRKERANTTSEVLGISPDKDNMPQDIEYHFPSLYRMLERR
jgi:hypothetical protein